MKAKLIRKIPQREGLPYYFRRYEFECIECGEHYIRGRCDKRTTPYCGKCQRKHDYEKQKTRAKEKEQAKIDAVLEDIKTEIRQKQWHIGVDSANQVIEIINKYTGGQNDQS